MDHEAWLSDVEKRMEGGWQNLTEEDVETLHGDYDACDRVFESKGEAFAAGVAAVHRRYDAGREDRI